MATYAFMNPLKAGKTETWKKYIAEMTGPRAAEFKESRKRIGLTKEQVWLQHTPAGDFVVVYWEAADIGKVFEAFMTSQAPFDTWFREKILQESHGMDAKTPMPPMNEGFLGAQS